MKTATIHEIKKELETLEPKQVQALCLRLAKFKKDSKELLTYLLFEAHDEQTYIENGKREITEQFSIIPNPNVYYVKKSVRKILRMVNKLTKYSGLPITDLEMRIHFCQQMKENSIPIDKSQVLMNLYQQQLMKINQGLGKMDEDLQFDYQAEIKNLNNQW